MNVLVCTDSHYLKATLALLGSLARQPKRGDIRLYLAGVGLTGDALTRINRVAQGKFKELVYVDGSEAVGGLKRLPLQRWMTHTAYLKLLLPDNLPLEADRAIVLDADVVVESDLDTLWKTTLGDVLLHAVQDYGCPYVSCPLGIKHYRALGLAADAPYFNSGVMLIDLERWRAQNVPERCFDYLLKHRNDLRCHDQEALNAVATGNWGRLDSRWNQMPHVYWLDHLAPSHHREELREQRHKVISEPYIIHFAARSKPWLPGCLHPARRRFFYYLRTSGGLSLHEYIQWRWALTRTAERPTTLREPHFDTAQTVHDTRASLAVDTPQPLDREVGERADRKRYRVSDVSVAYAGRQQRWVYSERASVSRILSVESVQMLMSCTALRHLDEHARAFCETSTRRAVELIAAGDGRQRPGGIAAYVARLILRSKPELRVSTETVERCYRQLEDFVRDGFLRPENNEVSATHHVSTTSQRSTSYREFVSSLGVPTCGRPALLEQALSSYAANVCTFSRAPLFTVVDDSRDNSSRSETLAVCEDIQRRFGVTIRVVDRISRLALARRLGRAANIPLELAEFAILGDSRCDQSYGAARNTLQVMSAGTMAIQVDDDTVCRVAVPVTSSGSRRPYPARESTEYWFYSDPDTLADVVTFVDRDFIGLHEELLGVPFDGSLLGRSGSDMHTDLNSLSPESMRHIAHPDASVAITLGGSVGDSGMRDAWGRLFVEGASFDRLARHPGNYRSMLSTRTLVRMSAAPAVSDEYLCFAMNIGIDNRRLLPPFMPVQRKEDGIFRLMMRHCMPFLFCGHMPFGIVHAPTDRPAQESLRFSGVGREFFFNDCIEWLLDACGNSPIGDDAAKNLTYLGQSLLNLATLSPRRFQEHLRLAAIGSLANQIRAIERLLDERRHTAPFWERDALRYVSALHSSMVFPAFFVPNDLRGSPEDKLLMAQSLLERMGRLLMHWPAVWEAAKTLNHSEPEYWLPAFPR